MGMVRDVSDVCRCAEMCVDGTRCVWKSLEVLGDVSRYVEMGGGVCRFV